MILRKTKNYIKSIRNDFLYKSMEKVLKEHERQISYIGNGQPTKDKDLEIISNLKSKFKDKYLNLVNSKGQSFFELAERIVSEEALVNFLEQGDVSGLPQRQKDECLINYAPNGKIILNLLRNGANCKFIREKNDSFVIGHKSFRSLFEILLSYYFATPFAYYKFPNKEDLEEIFKYKPIIPNIHTSALKNSECKYKALIEKIPHQYAKDCFQSYFDKEVAKIQSCKMLEQFGDLPKAQKNKL